jgi:soluble lytic murein transglycosylase
VRCLWCWLDIDQKKVIILWMKTINHTEIKILETYTKNLLIFAISLFCILFCFAKLASATNSTLVLKAIAENDFNQQLELKDQYPWLQDYITKLLKTDLDFANSIKPSKKKLALLEDVLKKTSFVPTQIQILNQIATLQKILKLKDDKTLKDIQELTAPVSESTDCKAYSKKGDTFRDLRDFEQSLFNFQAAFDCFDTPEPKISALKQITLTHKVKHRGKDFLNASLETYNFTKKAFSENKIPANQFNKIGIEHVRTVWTYQSAEAAMVYLKEMKKLLDSNYSLQTVYWIYARIYEEKKDLKKSQKYLALALKEKPLATDDIISIYWQKFWNHLELNQMQEAEDALKASLEVGDPSEGQARTYYWLIISYETKLKKMQSEFDKPDKTITEDSRKKLESDLASLKLELESLKSTLMTKYPISFYTALINKKNGLKYSKSDLEDLSSKTYKTLPKSFDFNFYKELHHTSTLATQSFLRKYYSHNKKKITKDQRFLIKRLMARNGETTELFIELESRPEICTQESAPCMDLFPTPYQDVVQKSSKKYKVPAELVYSIIRQESIFNPLAKSWADARGLMQLLPSLAKEISKKAEVEYTSPLDLYSVEKNIFFGTYLIKSLITEMNDSIVLGLCGYNAEKSRAKTWYKTRFNKDWLKFIEEIPYQETRNYNKLVLRNFLIYSNNDDAILKSWFPDGILN